MECSTRLSTDLLGYLQWERIGNEHEIYDLTTMFFNRNGWKIRIFFSALSFVICLWGEEPYRLDLAFPRN